MVRNGRRIMKVRLDSDKMDRISMERERSGYSSVRNSKFFHKHMVEKSVNMVSELRRPTGDTHRGRESSYEGS